VAIFLTRTRIVDGSGRMVDELLIPVEVCADIEGPAQQVCRRWHSRVRTVCLAEVADRIAALAPEYRRGLERARIRESQLADIARAHRRALVQPGLFDRRADERAYDPDHERRESLTNASSLLLARQSETILLIVIH
jgi:hypothetical protein